MPRDRPEAKPEWEIQRFHAHSWHTERPFLDKDHAYAVWVGLSLSRDPVRLVKVTAIAHGNGTGWKDLSEHPSR